MQKEDGIYIGRYALLSSIKACAKLKDAQKGSVVHFNIVQMGLQEMDPIIGSALVDMYSECGLLSRARQAFDKSFVRDVILWTSLMAGYVKHGQAAEALKCFQLMKLENIPDAVTYVYCLKACTLLGAFRMGKDIHNEVENRGLLKGNHYLGSALVDMYAKGGLLVKAQQVCDRLLDRDTVVWNALLQGYATYGHGDEGLQCLDKMQSHGVSPDSVTFACALKVCSSQKAMKRGQELHSEIDRLGLLENDLVLGNSVIDMYVKCASLSKARQVLDKLPVRDVVSWTALIAGYGDHGFYEEALACFKQMRSEGIFPNAVTYVCSLKACASVKEMNRGREIYHEIERVGLLERDLVVGNAVLDLYIKCDVLEQALQVFNRLENRNVVSWNTMIAGYGDYGQGREALELFSQMQCEGFLPDAVTFACSLKACCIRTVVRMVQEIEVRVESAGLLQKDVFVGITLVDIYAKIGLLDKAQQIFEKLQHKDLIAWNALITGYLDYGCAEAALQQFEKLQADGISPNVVTFVCSLKACSIVGATDVGREIHSEIARMGLLEKDHIVGNTLVDMYAKCGLVAAAHEVLWRLPGGDVSAWNSLMAGYTSLGESWNVFHILNQMLNECLEPDSITFLIALNASCRTGFLSTSETCFETMTKDYGLVPTFKHCGCFVNLFSRRGQLDKAIALTEKVTPISNFVAWHMILDACQTLGNEKLGKHTFETVNFLACKETFTHDSYYHCKNFARLFFI